METILLWSTVISWATRFFKIGEKEFWQTRLAFFRRAARRARIFVSGAGAGASLDGEKTVEARKSLFDGATNWPSGAEGGPHPPILSIWLVHPKTLLPTREVWSTGCIRRSHL